jgi:hypothetical protein
MHADEYLFFILFSLTGKISEAGKAVLKQDSNCAGYDAKGY